MPAPACWHLPELVTAVVVIVVRCSVHDEEVTVVAVVVEVGAAPAAARAENAPGTKAASTHTATAEPTANGGTVRAAAAMVTASTVTAASTVAAASTVTATSDRGIERNRDGQSRHGC